MKDAVPKSKTILEVSWDLGKLRRNSPPLANGSLATLTLRGETDKYTFPEINYYDGVVRLKIDDGDHLLGRMMEAELRDEDWKPIFVGQQVIGEDLHCRMDKVIETCVISMSLEPY